MFKAAQRISTKYQPASAWRRLAATAIVTASGLMACVDEESTVATPTVATASEPLTVNGSGNAVVQALSGTYGAGCNARSGSWSTPIGAYASTMSNSQLSVVLNDADCVLTLTAVRIDDVEYEPTATLDLSSSYAGSPLTFSTGSPAFYANFKVSPSNFSSAFTITMYASNDATNVPTSRAATYATVAPTGSSSLNPPPDYGSDASGVTITTDAGQVVQSASGNVVLTVGSVVGETYVLKTSGSLTTSDNAAVHTAYNAGTPVTITGSPFNVTPANLGITVGVTTLPKTSYIIIANTANGVNTYQVITVTFNAATS